MKLTWKNKDNRKRSFATVSKYPNLPFDDQNDNFKSDEDVPNREPETPASVDQPGVQLELDADAKRLAQEFRAQGDQLAEEGKYKEALGKWETALTLMPGCAALHEQKAQVLLEIGDAWGALKAAIRATELEASWPEAWITLGRAQLNFGEPDSAIESFGKALDLKPDSAEARDDRQAALHLVKKRKHLQSLGLSPNSSRFVVGDKTESS